MTNNSTPNYLGGYSPEIQAQVRRLLDAGALADVLRERHPANHEIRSNKALSEYTMKLKNAYMRKSKPLSKVIYDDKIRLRHHALGLHSYVSRPQGNRTKAKNEIRISSRLKRVPEAMLRSVVVHELAHLREKDHSRAFYKLCEHMEPDYHQYEFDLRLYLTLVDAGGVLHE